MRIGFIGCGNMTKAIALGAFNAGAISAENIFIYDHNYEKAKELCDKYDFNACLSQGEAEIKSDLLIIAVKPNCANDVLTAITRAKTVVSIVAGLSTEKIKKSVKTDVRVLRIMPNTPLLVGEGVSAFAMPTTLNEEELKKVKSIFGLLGDVVEVSESLIDAVTGISGSGPAYVYMFIEALADAAVKHGIKRDDAIKLAAKTVMGSAQMVLKTGEHPAKLKDDVTSPGGTTIEAISVLEEEGLRSAIIKAVDACVDKAKNLS